MSCAICDSVRTIPFLVAKDMYTGEAHRIVRCEGCGLIRTEQSTSSEAMYVYGETADVAASVLCDGRRIGEIPPTGRVAVRLGEQRSLLATLPEVTFFRRYRNTFTA